MLGNLTVFHGINNIDVRQCHALEEDILVGTSKQC